MRNKPWWCSRYPFLYPIIITSNCSCNYIHSEAVILVCQLGNTADLT